MAHKKAQGAGRNARDGQPHYRGVKKYAGEIVKAGNIIIRQCGTKFVPGRNVMCCTDYTLMSLIDGVVKFDSRRRVSVYPKQQ